jgi:hypothetical protein
MWLLSCRVARNVCCEHMYATPEVVFRHLQHDSRCLGSLVLVDLAQATLERGMTVESWECLVDRVHFCSSQRMSIRPRESSCICKP